MVDDYAAVQRLVQDWAVYRDAGDWERFAHCWHDDGVMMATWFQGSWRDFIRVSREGFERGVRILHFLGGTSVDFSADQERAISQTKMTITQRATVHDVEVDVVCTGRFYDFLEKREGVGPTHRIVTRQPIYEQDRIDAVQPDAKLELDPERLIAFPIGYRHLAYIQSLIGYEVKRDMPGLTGPEVQELYARGARWLSGDTKRGERP